MGADTKALRGRIKSVDSTLHLTKAMGLVASSKMRRATAAMLNGREYAAAFEQLMRLLIACPACEKSPYMAIRDGGRTRLIVIAGDRGMAGGYNANVFRLAATLEEAELLPIGKRACERYGGEIYSSEDLTSAEAAVMAEELCRDFAEGKYDRLGIVSTRYVSMMTQEAEVSWVLPLNAADGKEPVDALFEPDAEMVLTAAVPEYVAGRLVAALRESFACEVAARRTAMDAAGKNARQMIDELQLEYNRARQGAITQEITEIVAGSGME
ncbi:MAG: ATP synthase F1 subunit gamma [Clostridia bacterium]|nr:ATP synthase F1 subunit gamma [Clostridia bacterium]